jgi:hypothetical protein
LTSFEREVEWRPLLDQLPCERHQQALEIITRLYGERALLEGNGEHPQTLPTLRWVVEGSGELSERLRAAVPAISANAIHAAARTLDTRCRDFNRRGGGQRRRFGFRADRWAADSSAPIYTPAVS